ncbi:hypothetical protein B0H13DRAFT_2380593 [Mycena leptocephala]|nr:hypothetical protein B0H13DRAFT_2380593 [Mycena leptocephala]
MASVAFESDWAAVLPQIIQSASSLFLNGRSVLICAMTVAFILGTLQMIYQVVFTAMLLKLLHSAGTVETASAQQDIQASIVQILRIKSAWDGILILINNFAADSLFIYRCYVIWGKSGHQRQVIGPPLLLLFSTIFGVTTLSLNISQPANSEIDSIIVVFVSLFTTNLLLTGLTAGRIWWTRHHLKVVGESKLVRRYNTAIAMLFESSALYLVLLLAFLLIQILGGPAAFDSPALSFLGGARPLITLQNIIPALIIVRVSLARSVDTDSTAGDLKVESSVY